MARTPRTKVRAKTDPKTRNRRSDDPEQYKRFREFAREHETDESEDAFAKTFKTLIHSHKTLP
jgi:hypothetical protein